MQRKLFTVITFVKINTRRFFRDKTAIFFTILFPLIFLCIFGGLFGGSSNNLSFKIAVINKSKAPAATQFVNQLKSQGKTFKIDKAIKTLAAADDKMGNSELDATIELPEDFGVINKGQMYPTGNVVIHYTQNNQSAASAFSSIIEAELKPVNAQYVKSPTPFTVSSVQSNKRSLSQFDYTFAGLLGFSIIGLGIFGPVNVFPELKKQGILRRLHTTPLRVWQYFLATMLSQAVIGMVTMAVMFAFAIAVFHLKVIGNYAELVIFLSFGIIMMLGIGLAIGGWAKNERQAAPLGNLVSFPLMFLSGTFFPRFLMPQWLQHITYYLPLTPVIDGVRLIATEGKSLIDIAPQVGLVALWGVVIYIIAFRVFRWE